MRRLSRAVKVRRAGEVQASGLLDHYRKSLADIHEVGYMRCWLREFRPYLNGAFQQFSTKRVSTIERLLDQRHRRGHSAQNEDEDLQVGLDASISG